MESGMHNHGAIFQPEDLQLLRWVFEGAVKDLPVSMRSSPRRSQIAKNILDCAATGERDPVELKIAGLSGIDHPAHDKHAA
jgi:hypothetical protein